MRTAGTAGGAADAGVEVLLSGKLGAASAKYGDAPAKYVCDKDFDAGTAAVAIIHGAADDGGCEIQRGSCPQSPAAPGTATLDLLVVTPRAPK